MSWFYDWIIQSSSHAISGNLTQSEVKEQNHKKSAAIRQVKSYKLNEAVENTERTIIKIVV